MRHFFLVSFLTIFVYAFASAQTDADKIKEKQLRRTAFLEQVLTDAQNLRLPENRAIVFARLGNALWRADEKRAREFFQKAIDALVDAQLDAENERAATKRQLTNLIYGQTPRWEILNWIANCDADFALDALQKTRPAKLAQAIAAFTGERSNSPNEQAARAEIESEQRLFEMTLDRNPQRTVKLLRESLRKNADYTTLNLLRKLHQTDAPEADKIAEEVGRKLLGANIEEENQTLGFLRIFINELTNERAPDDPQAIKVSDELMRALVEKIIKYNLQPNVVSQFADESALKVAARYAPASVAPLKEKQAKYDRQNRNSQDENYSNLLNGDAAPAELLSRAAEFPSSQRSEIYRRAASKTAEAGNVAEAEKIIRANFGEEEAERWQSQMYYNLAQQASYQGKFGEAGAYANRVADDNLRFSALSNLASQIYAANPKENQKQAFAVLAEARAILPDAPETSAEINSLLELAQICARIEPDTAFSWIENLTPQLNEYSDALATLAKFGGRGNFRQGEFQIGGGNNLPFISYLTNTLVILQKTDFERAARFAGSFNRTENRVSLELLLIQQIADDSEAETIIFSNSFIKKRMQF